MTKDYNYFSFSIFTDCKFDDFTSVVLQIKHKEIELRKIDIISTAPYIEDFINPKSGGAHLPKFCYWENANYPNMVFFISNYEDGLYTLCNVIHQYTNGNLIMCSLSNERTNKAPFFQFYYSDCNFNERSVLAYKDTKWIFYDKGTPLSIENVKYYGNKYIKNRLNTSIIEEYLQKMGINLWDIDSSIDRCITFVQNRW
jgi:hypothetical protein